MSRVIFKIARPWFVCLVIITIIHQVLEKIHHIYTPFIHSYLDPLLLMPILLHFLLWEKRLLLKRGIAFTFSSRQLFIYFAIISFVTEYLFPKWNSGFTADIWDIACYGLGTLIFGTCFNKPYNDIG